MKGISIIDKTIKFSKFLSNFKEFEIQYRLDKKYPNPKNHPTQKLLIIFLLKILTKI